MQIGNIHAPHAAQGLQGPHSTQAKPQAQTDAASPSAQPSDQLDISPSAKLALDSADGEGIRTDLVAKIKSQIADGSYDTADKLDAALDRLLDEIG